MKIHINTNVNFNKIDEVEWFIRQLKTIEHYSIDKDKVKDASNTLSNLKQSHLEYFI